MHNTELYQACVKNMDQVSKHIFTSVLGLKQSSIYILRVQYRMCETNQSHVTFFVTSLRP